MTNQEESLVAAIDGNLKGMAHADLVLTCEMLTRGRAQWRKQCEEALKEISESHAVLDDPECLIIRNAKDGYPDGRPDRVLNLPERVRALLRMKQDYKRWMESAHAQGMKDAAEIVITTVVTSDRRSARQIYKDAIMDSIKQKDNP